MDGVSYLNRENIMDVMSDCVVIFGEQSKQRVLAKLEKLWKKVENKGSDYADVDQFVDMCIEEYVEGKKRENKALAKAFSKTLESEHGVFSFEDIKKVCKEMLANKSTLDGLQFPKG